MNHFRINLSDIEFAKSKVTYLHNGKDVDSGAFDKTMCAEIRIKLPRCVGAVLLTARVFNESFTECDKITCKLLNSDLNFDTFSFKPPLSCAGLFFFDFEKSLNLIKTLFIFVFFLAQFFDRQHFLILSSFHISSSKRWIVPKQEPHAPPALQ